MKNYIVFGGSSGIGESVCELLNDENIIVVDKTPPKNHQFTFIPCDLSKPEGIFDLKDKLPSIQFDGVVYCAGIREISSFRDLTYKEWREVFHVNVDSFFMSVQLLNEQLNHHASIVNISSVSGVMGEPNRLAYVSSKHALIGLTKCLAIELSDRHIRVNSVAPGVIRTPLTESYYENESLISKINKNHILNRTGHVDEVAQSVKFLLSEHASFTTGSTLFVDGGWTAFKDI